ncbi:MAG TPA: copper chaperone PCu(A)C [Candidatus Acidoferrum sp.]|nr:copper chaperone PCu(A)C [Candidatus Acidoferrum sp.]
MSKTMKLMSVALLLATATLARAELVVEAGHVRASLPGSTTTAAYMTLKNTGDADIVITAASSPAAAHVSFHSTMNHGGMMHMMDMESLKIPAHKSLVLEAGGDHLMLEKTTAALAEGTTVELTFQLADGQHKTVKLPVKSVMNEKP